MNDPCFLQIFAYRLLLPAFCRKRHFQFLILFRGIIIHNSVIHLLADISNRKTAESANGKSYAFGSKGDAMSEKPTYEELEKRVHELEQIEIQFNRAKLLTSDEINWWRLLIDESRDGIVILDQNAKVYEANQQFAEMLGYSIEEIYQLHTWDWDAHLKKEQILELINTVDRTGAHFETQHRRKDGTIIDVELSNNGATYRGKKLIFCICRDITERNRAAKEREELIKRLEASLAEIKTLRGILPICSFCKKVRNDTGYWEQVDVYIHRHSEADISHSICPECLEKYYPEKPKKKPE